MRVPLEWLNEYCQPHMDAQTLAQRLALTGTEVERVEHHGVLGAENFVVGHVLERKKHPDADRLNVCMVDIGGSTPSQIVCGAPNVAAGQTVGVARPGAVMPDGTKLGKAKLRGVESQGMILSERELQISEDHDGIMVLDDGVAPGTPLADVLPIATDVLVLEITPNRPDCLGIYGVAREVAASTGAQLKPAPWEQDPGSFGELDGIEITNEAGHELCPRFTARIFEGIAIGPSPLWMKARLMACGQRPISNVVDITNYVMLLTGQPMHAFDYDRVAGRRLNVRRARPGEQVQTLDEQTRTLDEEIVVIEDAEGPTSIAGVMGGARSEVSDATTTVRQRGRDLERPQHPRHVAQAGAAQRGLEPQREGAAARADALGTGGRDAGCSSTSAARPSARGRSTSAAPAPSPPRSACATRASRACSASRSRASARRQLLQTIGFTAVDAADGLDVTVPDFRRADITREADLIEEVARLDGLENLPATLPARHSAVGRLTPVQRLRRRAEDALAAQGLHEIVGWSFTGPELAEKLRLLEAGSSGPLTLANPMSSEQSQLRTTLLGSLLDVAARNRARGASGSRIALFESGAIYRSKVASRPTACLTSRTTSARSSPARCVRRPGATPARRRPTSSPPRACSPGCSPRSASTGSVRPMTTGTFLHPGRAAAVLVDGEHLGWVGEIHPAVAAEWEFEDTLAGFEIDLSAIVPPAGDALQGPRQLPGGARGPGRARQRPGDRGGDPRGDSQGRLAAARRRRGLRRLPRP